MKTIVITLLTKGSLPYFHNGKLISCLNNAGFQVMYWAAEDTIKTINHIPGCNYIASDIELRGSWIAKFLIDYFAYIRKLYPAKLPNSKRNFMIELSDSTIKKKISYSMACVLAKFRFVTSVAAFLERFLLSFCLNSSQLRSIRPSIVLLGGLGQKNSIPDGHLSILCKKKGIPFVNAIINYDALTAKGFRGCSPQKLLVWGENMQLHAKKLHGIQQEKIKTIGSMRYNSITVEETKEIFFKAQGLDPVKKTVLFCGSVFPAHYNEVLRAFDELSEENRSIQLVVRLYPSKEFRESSFVKYFEELVKARENVYINYSLGSDAESDTKEFLELDEYTYWHLIKFSDAIVHYYSSVCIDSLVFEKRTISIDYYADVVPFLGRSLMSSMEKLYIHHSVTKKYGITSYAKNRSRLIEMIVEHMENNIAQGDMGEFIKDERGKIDDDFWSTFSELIREIAN